MAVKVVYNGKYGGFSLTRKCVLWMAERGSKEASVMLQEHEDDDQDWYGNWEGARHDPLLVEAIETLGCRTGYSSPTPQHEIHVLKGNKYIIKEYDGLETVIEPKDIRWIEVTCKEE